MFKRLAYAGQAFGAEQTVVWYTPNAHIIYTYEINRQVITDKSKGRID